MTVLAWPDAGGRNRGLIEGPAGALEVEIRRPRSSRGCAVICHPHPQHQGTMDNKVVYTLARAANEAGMTAIRFNFRGVGASEGGYAAGIGEVDDGRAVRDWVAEATGQALNALAGFSFGAAVALRLADAEPPPSLVTVGLPSDYFDSGLPRPNSRWLALYGDADDVIDVDASLVAVRELQPPVAVHVMEGAGHFLHGQLTELRKQIVAHWVDNRKG